MVKINYKIILVLTCYAIILHIFLAVAVLKTDIIHKVTQKLGIRSNQYELSEFYHLSVGHQLNSDKNVPEKSVLFFGDSRVQQLCVSAVTLNGINYGIGGDTTFGLLKRIKKYQSIQNSKVIVIAIGLNDLRYRSPNEIAENIGQILNSLPDNQPIILNAILPVDDNRESVRKNETIRGINTLLTRKVLLSRRQIFFLDLTEKLINSDGNLSSKYHVGDGVHLNEIGNRIWINELKTALSEVQLVHIQGKKLPQPKSQSNLPGSRRPPDSLLPPPNRS